MSVAKRPAWTIAPPQAVFGQRLAAFSVMFFPLLGTLWAIHRTITVGVEWDRLAMMAVTYFLTMWGITIGFHRLFAHRSFKTSAPMKHFLAALGSMAGQGPLVWWVAVHRRHHRFSDHEGDPHTPHRQEHKGWAGLKGFLYGHMGWMYSREITDWSQFAPDMLRDSGLFLQHRLYGVWMFLGLVLPTALGAYLWGGWFGAFEGFVWGAMVRMFFVDHALWLVGSLSHMIGRRPFASMTNDESSNNHFVALVAFGEGLQNNHHAFPNSASHAMEWWEPDISGWTIKILKKTGLVWEVKHPSPALLEKAKASTVTDIVEL